MPCKGTSSTENPDAPAISQGNRAAAAWAVREAIPSTLPLPHQNYRRPVQRGTEIKPGEEGLKPDMRLEFQTAQTSKNPKE